MFFDWDQDMYDPVMDEPARANTSDLNEELGQVMAMAMIMMFMMMITLLQDDKTMCILFTVRSSENKPLNYNSESFVSYIHMYTFTDTIHMHIFALTHKCMYD